MNAFGQKCENCKGATCEKCGGTGTVPPPRIKIGTQAVAEANKALAKVVSGAQQMSKSLSTVVDTVKRASEASEAINKAMLEQAMRDVEAYDDKVLFNGSRGLLKLVEVGTRTRSWVPLTRLSALDMVALTDGSGEARVTMLVDPALDVENCVSHNRILRSWSDDDWVILRITHKDGDSINLDARVEKVLTHWSQGELVTLTGRNVIHASGTRIFDPSKAQPTAWSETQLDASKSLGDGPAPCHVCGGLTVVRNAAGMPEHATCGAWDGVELE